MHTGELKECDICGGELTAPLLAKATSGYDCVRCSQHFLCCDKFVAHSYKHTGVKPFVCAACARAFTRVERLRSHTQTYHPS